MKGRESKGPPSADLLVCFPSRSHLTLMPKPICSPARPSEPTKRHPHNYHRHHLKRSVNRSGGGGGQASPLLWAKTKPMGSEIAEPTSPKVTCAGQIKVRPKVSPCKNWQSVMEEIERLHNSRKNKKRASWVEALGFKKDVMQFLTCLRNIRFDFRCFGSFPTSNVSSDEEDEDEEVDDQAGVDENENSKTVFSKWFMVLQEEQSNRVTREQSRERNIKSHKDEEDPVAESCAPPPNALLLMRCRSAPAKSWLEERQDEDEDEERESEEVKREKEKEEEMKGKEEEEEEEEEEKKSTSLAMVMRRDTDFYKLSSDIARETWVVGGLKDPFSRSRSWKR